VLVAVHSRVLDQNVQAMNEGSRRGRTVCMGCVYAGDKMLLVNASVKHKGKAKR
jgi:predicted metal-binding membrane protein